MDTHPLLRPLEIRRTTHRGTPMFALRDPLQIGQGLLVPQLFGPLLALLDGAHPLSSIYDQAELTYGHSHSADLVGDLLGTLDAALLLDNPRFAAARAAALQEFRAAPHRPLSHAGAVYPADPAALQRELDQHLAAAETHPLDHGRGVFCPHIDYARGAAVYAAVWKRAAPLAAACDLVVLFGTDHGGEPGSLTLTRQHYATPLGVLPTPLPLLDACAAAIGEELAFAGELRHRTEHSIELVAVWLHHARGGQPVELLPVLVGSFAEFVAGDADPAQHTAFAALLATIAAQTAGRRVLYVVSGDLSHVGPAFGGRAVDAAGRQRVRAADDAALGALASGDPATFFAELWRVKDRYNVCGLPPGYLALRALDGGCGEVVAYDQCPADDAGTSIVSVAGLIWT